MASEKFRLIESRLWMKIAIALLLFIMAVGLTIWNRGLLADQTRKRRAVTRQDLLLQENKSLMQTRDSLDRFFVTLEDGSDPEAIRSAYMSDILTLLQDVGNTPNSYASETQRREEEIRFSYNLSAFGNFTNLMRFMNRMGRELLPVRVKSYEMKKTGTDLIRADIQLEIMCRR